MGRVGGSDCYLFCTLQFPNHLFACMSVSCQINILVFAIHASSLDCRMTSHSAARSLEVLEVAPLLSWKCSLLTVDGAEDSARFIF